MAPAGLAWIAAMAVDLETILGVPGFKALPLVLLIGFLLGAAGFGRAPRVVGAGLLIAILAITWTPFFGRLARHQVRNDPMPDAPVDAIVVLSASVTADGDLSPHGIDRLLAGLELYREGRASRLVVSRIASSSHRGQTSDVDQRRIIAYTGQQPSLIVLDPVGTTRLEAVRAKEIADREGWRRIILVTSPVHTRRACATFEAIGFDVTCRPSRDRTMALGALPVGEDRLRVRNAGLAEISVARLD
jgi:uncharacterized SAM-binding protein YcdF (DUF218 family)